MSGLDHLGDTQQRLMRALLAEHAGSTVETLCAKLRITHNAVRQHQRNITVQRHGLIKFILKNIQIIKTIWVRTKKV